MAPPQATAEAPEVIFRIPKGPGQNVNDVRIEQPELLRRRSLALRKLIDKESASQRKIITLQLDPKSDIDSAAIEWVLNDLQREGDALQPDGGCKSKVFAKHCAVLWNYECDPDQFKRLGNRIQPRSSRPSSSPSIDQQSTTGIALSTSPSGSSRCWQGKRNSLTCGHLITIAIVLGLEDILEEEIRVAVWGTNKKVETSVPLGKEKDIKG
jgi:hypothetical protein